MFFSGGISGFFNDLYYGVVEKGYKLTHPRIWNCVLKSKAEVIEDGDEENEDIIYALQSIGIEDKELFELIEEAEDMDHMSQKEMKKLVGKLREKEATVDFSKFAELLENGRKKGTLQSQELGDWEKIFEIASKKWNSYDTFPEEKKYYSFDEIMEIMQRLYHMKKKAALSEK